MGEKREVVRLHDDGILDYGTDAEGKKYSAENSPKRDEKTKAAWAKYNMPMSVKDALAAHGNNRSVIRRDRRAGYITYTAPAKEAEAAE